jgi:uncharacterized protein YecE (DUF72 family)
MLVSFTANFTDLSRMKKNSQNQRSIFFFEVMRSILRKLLALLLQLPPPLTAQEGLKKLEAFIHMLDHEFRYAIELRYKSWFDKNRLQVSLR